MKYEHGRISKADDSAYVGEDYLVHGTAKFWVTHNMGGATFDSLNMSSKTDNGTGDTTFTFASVMDNANYNQAGITEESGVSPHMGTGNTGANITTAFTRNRVTLHTSSSGYDAELVCFSILGDLAA